MCERLSGCPLLQHCGHYARLLRLQRPVGTVLLAWPAVWALWVAAEGPPPWDILVVFLVGTFLMRSAGCVINDYCDRDIDPHVARTRHRPLAAGYITPHEALWIASVLLVLAFILVLHLNRMTLMLVPVALLLAVCYPLMKRITHWPQLFLGIAFSWSVPMAFTAVTMSLPAVAWLLFAAGICWTLAYDTAYAMADIEDDRKVGVGSTALLFGRYARAAVAALHAACLVLLAILGMLLDYPATYYLGLLIAAVHAAGQQKLLRDGAYIRAFTSNGWFGAAVFLGLLTISVPWAVSLKNL